MHAIQLPELFLESWTFTVAAAVAELIAADLSSGGPAPIASAGTSNTASALPGGRARTTSMATVASVDTASSGGDVGRTIGSPSALLAVPSSLALEDASSDSISTMTAASLTVGPPAPPPKESAAFEPAGPPIGRGILWEIARRQVLLRALTSGPRGCTSPTAASKS